MVAVKKILGVVTALLLSGPSFAAELVMVEQAGCAYCELWNKQIAPIYSKTDEGAFAPLRRVGLRALPDDLEIARRVMFTPTFLIVQDGREIARLEGYPGEHFFWPLLDELLSAHTSYDPQPALAGKTAGEVDG